MVDHDLAFWHFGALGKRSQRLTSLLFSHSVMYYGAHWRTQFSTTTVVVFEVVHGAWGSLDSGVWSLIFSSRRDLSLSSEHRSQSQHRRRSIGMHQIWCSRRQESTVWTVDSLSRDPGFTGIYGIMTLMFRTFVLERLIHNCIG